MSDRFYLCLDPLLAEPPRKVFIRDDGGIIYEHMVMVGWVAVEPWQKATLEHLGIETTYARHSPQTKRFERCLFSLEVAGTLAALKSTGELKFDFAAELSVGGGRWVEAQAAGKKTEALPLSAFLAVEAK